MNDAQQVTVIVTASNHHHAGQPVAKGSQLQVDQATAQWLIDNKLAVAAKPADTAQPTAKKEPKE